MSRPSRAPSIERRLPIAIGGLLVLLLAVMAWVAYLSVAAAAREAAAERLIALGRQFSAALTAEARRAGLQVDSVARRPAVVAYLTRPGPGTLPLLEEAVRYPGPRAERLRAVELRDAAGRIRHAVGPNAPAVASALEPALLARADSAKAGVLGPFTVVGDSIFLPAVAPVLALGRPLGYVVEWWLIHASPEEQKGTLGLLGPGAVLLFGSTNGVWTDQVRPVASVPLPVADTGSVLRYRRAELGARLAYAGAVPGAPWFVAVEFPEEGVLAPARRFLRDVLLLAGGLLLLGLAGVWWYTRRITGPLRALTDAAEAVSAGDYSSRVRVERADELGRLGQSFDRMAERIEESHLALETSVQELRSTRQQFIHVQRMEAVGRLAGGVAHDFNNLLSIILAECDLARAGLDRRGVAAESVGSIQKAAERAAGLTRQLLAFSRRQLVEPRLFNMNDLVDEMAPMLRRLLGERLELRVELGSVAPVVRADRGQMEQVLMNLVVNARDAMPEGGRLGIETQDVILDEEYAAGRPEVTPGRCVMMVVSDSGEGMSEEVKAHIFEPFFTTKESGRGTGLGLATCYGIVKQNGGHIAVYSEPGVGSTFRVFLPAVQALPEPVGGPETVVTGGDETVLLVEDDPGLRDVATRILVRLGYTVLPAATGDEALAALDRNHREIHLLLTDVVLPGMGGRELAEAVTRRRPATRVLYVTGYTEDTILQHQLLARDVVLLQKPYTADLLGRKVREVLGAA